MSKFKEFFMPSTYFSGEYSMYGLGHIVMIVAMFIAMTLIIVLRKKLSHKRIKSYLVVNSFVWVGLEIFKIVLFFSLTNNKTQALREVLPFYMCSLFVYALPVASFCKGIVKKVGEYTLISVCLLGGMLTTINCPALLNYPFGSFIALHSLFYHVFMACTGVALVASGYVKVDIKSFYLPMVSIVLLSIPAIIANNIFNTDYMLLRYAWGTPVLGEVAVKIGQPLQIALMMMVYLLICFIMCAIVCLITKLSKKPQTN